MAIAALAQLDNAFPKFSGSESTEQKLNTITDYLYQQNEVIRYLLSHIGVDNLDKESVDEYLNETITKPIDIRLTDDEGNMAKLEITADHVTSQLSSVPNWDAETTYTKGTAVNYEIDGSNHVFVCKTKCTGVEPPNETYWEDIGSAIYTESSYAYQESNRIGAIVSTVTDGEGDEAKVVTASLDIVADATGSQITLDADRIALNGKIYVNPHDDTIRSGQVWFSDRANISAEHNTDWSDIALSCSGAVEIGSSYGLILGSGVSTFEPQMWGTKDPDNVFPSGSLYPKPGQIYFQLKTDDE